MEVYPIYLNRLDEVLTIVVGGDHEAERKIRELLQRNARLKVISPELTPRLEEWAGGRFEWVARPYREGDLESAFMVIVADFEGDANERIYREARAKGIPVNVMDDIPHCTFVFGSVLKRGPLTLSISTSGAAPALAVRLRERFEREFGEEYVPYLRFLQQLRGPMARVHPEFESRKKLWYRLVDSNLLELFRDNRVKEARELAEEIAGEEVLDGLTDEMLECWNVELLDC